MTTPEPTWMANQRDWREKTERLRDLEERFEREKSTATARDDYRELANELTKVRRAYRLEGESLGRRAAGGGVAIHTMMWPVWFTIAVDHELDARRAYQRLLEHHSEALVAEFHASLVTVAASASALEALLSDIRYLVPAIPEKKRRETRKAVRAVWSTAFSPPPRELDSLSRNLKWLFDTRNTAVHAATESRPTRPHPAGLNSGLEHQLFNAVTAESAVDIAKTALLLSATPRPIGLDQERVHWILRWSRDRSTYHQRVVDTDLRRSGVSRPLPVNPDWNAPSR